MAHHNNNKQGLLFDIRVRQHAICYKHGSVVSARPLSLTHGLHEHSLLACTWLGSLCVVGNIRMVDALCIVWWR